MAIWSKKSKSSPQTNNQAGNSAAGMQGNPERRYNNGGQLSADDMTVQDFMTGMPTITLSTLIKGLMKQIFWVIPLFVIGVFAIYYLTKDIKRTYVGTGSLLVQIGPEYIYTPIGANNGNNNGGGISQTPDTIALNEVGIMKNPELIEQVIGIMTSPRDNLTEEQAQDLFAKAVFKKIRAAERTGSRRKIEDAYAELHKFVDEAYYVAPRPKSSLIDVGFKHENPDIAVESVNQFIDAYKNYRRTIFVEGSEDTISERRDETEKQLNVNERAIARFLERNDISDFTSEQDGLRERSEDLKTELNTLRGLMSETEASLSTVEDQLRNTNQDINLYVDDRASQRVAQAELELKQLLAKYLPTSNPVQQKRTEIAELRSLQSANNGQAAGGRRVGPNPVHQALVTQRNTLQASADSYREKEFVLQRQLDSAVAKVRRLTQLSPEHQNLIRERTTLSDALDTYNARAQEAAVNLAQAEANNENIKVISYANFATKGTNTGKLLLAGGSLAWGLTLLMLALLIVFLNPENFKAPGTNNKGPRRRRSADKNNDNERTIPDAVSPYEPRTPLAGTLSAGTLSAEALGPDGSAAASHVPAQYNPTDYSENYSENYSGQPNYGAAPSDVPSHAPAYIESAPSVPSALDAHNPYLEALNQQGYQNPAYQDPAYQNPEAQYNAAQANALPVLGRFSAGQA